MYAIRCTVTHGPIGQAIGLYKSNYVILVDTPKLYTAFSVAKRAMKDRYHLRYGDSQFEFSSGAQKVSGQLEEGKLFQIIFTN